MLVGRVLKLAVINLDEEMLTIALTDNAQPTMLGVKAAVQAVLLVVVKLSSGGQTLILSHLSLAPLPHPPQDARARLKCLAGLLRELAAECALNNKALAAASHTAAADILLMYAHTSTWFTAEKYKSTHAGVLF